MPIIDQNKTALYGYCFGGTAAMLYSFLGKPISAAVAFHPGGARPPVKQREVPTPLLIQTGGNDIGVATQLEIEEALSNVTSTFELTRYAHIEHSFTVWESAAYDAAVDARSWRAASTFIASAFAGDTQLEQLAASQRVESTALLSKGIVSRHVTFEHDGDALSGYVYSSATQKASDPLRAGVVIIHDADGITDYEHTRAAMLVDQGFVAFVGDVYGSDVQARVAGYTSQQRGALLGGWRGNPDRFVARVLANVAQLAEVSGVDANRLGVIGYCFGGTAVLDLALHAPAKAAVAASGVKAVVAFHGGLGQRAGGADVREPINIAVAAQMGALDEDPTDVAALENEMTQRQAQFEFTRFSGARHAFTVFGGSRYQSRADARSFASGVDFLRTYIDPEAAAHAPERPQGVGAYRAYDASGLTSLDALLSELHRFAANAARRGQLPQLRYRTRPFYEQCHALQIGRAHV